MSCGSGVEPFFVKKLKWLTRGSSGIGDHFACNTMSAHSDPRGPRARLWTGVLNNYTDEELTSLTQLDCLELVIDKEVGEEGTPHLHIYCRFDK